MSGFETPRPLWLHSTVNLGRTASTEDVRRAKDHDSNRIETASKPHNVLQAAAVCNIHKHRHILASKLCAIGRSED